MKKAILLTLLIISNSWSEPYSLKIKILPPWYLTYWAYALYTILFTGLLLYAVIMVHKKQKRKRVAVLERIKQEQREEYESKLRFFTNMTHELCTPLTLIYGPCNRILSHSGVDEFVKKHVLMIQHNAEKLNDLIQDIIEYRRIETTDTTSAVSNIDFTSQNSAVKAAVLESNQYSFDKSRPTILIIDDESEMLWFIADIFLNRYNVFPVSSSGVVIETIRQIQPDIIISDIVMPEIDGISLIKNIKSDKTISHIPIILLSAQHQIENQIEGIQSGADAYITKPFNVDYLITIVEKLLKQKENMKDYYNSAISAFEFTDGKLIHIDDKLFFEKMIQIISDNIKNPDLSTDFVASALALSTRQLYRRLKNICSQTPSEIIKEHRLHIAENLLIKTNLTIDEIIFQSGFTNRAAFFKLFSDKHNSTPKNYREKKLNEIR